jgi:hypothetical protein
MFQFLLRNGSWLNQNHFVKLFSLFIETFRKQLKKVNNNHSKHLFCCFTSVGQNLKMFPADPPLKHFTFLLFHTVPTNLA